MQYHSVDLSQSDNNIEQTTINHEELASSMDHMRDHSAEVLGRQFPQDLRLPCDHTVNSEASATTMGETRIRTARLLHSSQAIALCEVLLRIEAIVC